MCPFIMENLSKLFSYVSPTIFIFSLAKVFETRLMEVRQQEKQSLSPERAQMLFDVFDQVLPQLGIFKKVLAMVRDELFGKR